jgi:hypothetical protein
MWSPLAFVLLAAANLIAAPEDWRKETFTFPLAFAPSIPYEGTEHVRFPPSWDKFATENGFSYVILWDLKATPVAPEDLEDHLEAYFNGLMSNVARARKVEAATAKTAVSAHPMTGVPGWSQAFGAEVRTSNAFSKNEALLLHGEIAQRDCGAGRMQVFFAFSRARRDRPVWEALREARKATPCPVKVS